MKPQEKSKDVVITSFSICGVDGFRTVYASGGKPEKRMFSALNQMDRMIKAEADVAIGSPHYDGNVLYRRAAALLRTIKDRIALHNDMGQLAVTGEPQHVTTEQFLAESDWVYRQNITHFLNKLDEIDTGIDKHLSSTGQLNKPPKPTIFDLEPSLYILTGGIFKDEHFHIFLTPLDIREMGEGDLQKAVEYFVAGAVITTKNYKLSDYLRLEDRAKEKVKHDLLFLDAQLDRLSDIRVKSAGTLISRTGMGTGKSKAAYDRVKDTSDTLLLEAEYRLGEFVSEACNKAHSSWITMKDEYKFTGFVAGTYRIGDIAPSNENGKDA